MEDRALMCRDCGHEFVYTISEQEFFASKGFNDPQRCPVCRAQRKRERAGSDVSASMSAPKFERARDVRTWTEVVCAECGQLTRVPFRPTAGRPIYCNDCFAVQRNRGFQTDSRTLPRQPMTRPDPFVRNARSAVSEFTEESSTHSVNDYHPDDDFGPVPDVIPGPDEEGEITVAEYIPMSFGMGSTPEEVEPRFVSKTGEGEPKR